MVSATSITSHKSAPQEPLAMGCGIDFHQPITNKRFIFCITVITPCLKLMVSTTITSHKSAPQKPLAMGCGTDFNQPVTNNHFIFLYNPMLKPFNLLGSLESWSY